LNHNTQVEIISANIAKYQGEIRDGEALIASLDESLAAAQATLATQEENLAANRSNLANAEQEKVDLVAAHEADVADYEDALQLIEQAVAHLNEAQAHFDGADLASQSSFIQVKNTVAAFVQKMTVTTQKMRASHQLFIKPVIQAMNQIASSSKQSSIQVAINALNDLSAYFSRALNNAVAIFESNLENVNFRIASFEAQISLLVETLIPETQGVIADLESKLEVAHENLEVSRGNLAVSQQDLVNENEDFDRITVRHEALVAKISEEYSIVIQAQNIINEAKAQLE
jgi:exonuclease VII small subunit